MVPLRLRVKQGLLGYDDHHPHHRPAQAVSGGCRMTDLSSLPQGHFGAILADPPWSFLTYSGKRSTPHRTENDHYQTMTMDAMKAMPIGDLAAKDCALFMWVVGSHLDAAIDLGRAWGFSLKTDAFYWLKTRMHGAGQLDMFTGDVPEPRISMGYWTRKQAEPCWLFTRGKPKRLAKDVRQVIVEPRREHSRKPDVTHERISRLVGGPYLELFAREPRPGWTVWGNQTDKFSQEKAA